jgi:hypothetical protein
VLSLAHLHKIAAPRVGKHVAAEGVDAQHAHNLPVSRSTCSV